MARILVNATMIRFPLGGMNQWILSWLVGFQQLGHEVFLVECSGWENACFDVRQKIMTDDCSYGVSVVQPLLDRHGLGNNWSFIDQNGVYHGLPEREVDDLFRNADAFLDFEWGEFFDRATDIPVRIFMDGEPGWFQVKLARDLESGRKLREYDHYFTTGANVGTTACSAPTAGIRWQHTPNPIILGSPPPAPASHSGRFTTVMSWQSNSPVQFKGKTYGQKDIEFEKFMELPRRVSDEIEVAVSGPAVPRQRLAENGWHVRHGDEVACSNDSYLNYIRQSKGEFSVAKNSFVTTHCGWLGDREGVYLGFGKPVVVQDTGITSHLPCGEGLFAVRNVDEAAEAIREISADYRRHSIAAREIATRYLSTEIVARSLLNHIGLM